MAQEISRIAQAEGQRPNSSSDDDRVRGLGVRNGDGSLAHQRVHRPLSVA
jgi:hypothetical protein